MPRNDGGLCNKCLMKIIRASRPSFVSETKNYPNIIRENYDWDNESLRWIPKTSA